MKTTYAFIVTGLAAQQAAATWDLFASPFLNTPKYNNNECSDKQKGGFDWSDLKTGDKNFKYGDFDFSGGWSCSNSLGKRDHLTRRTFGSKMIKNTVSKDKPASFSCDQRTSGFSITDIDVSVEFDTDLEMHYNMPDGSKCKQYSSCSQGGTTLKNTQCGGAKSVDVYLGSHYKGGKSSCEIGLHHIGFDCDGSEKYTPPAAPDVPSYTPATSATPVVSTSSAATTCYGGDCGSKPPSVPTGGVGSKTPGASTSTSTSATECGQYGAPACSSTDKTPPSVPTGGVGSKTPEASTSSTPPAETPSSGTECGQYGAPACSTTVETPPSVPTGGVGSKTPEASTVTSATECGQYGAPACSTAIQTPSSAIPSSSAAIYTNSSSIAYSSPPSSETPVVPPPSGESSTATPACGYGQSCEGSTAVTSPPASTGVPVASVSSAAPKPTPSAPTYAPVSPPDVLPKCMNTWLQVDSTCKNNADTACYCKNPDFTKSVIECVSAWCGTDEETKTALQYLIGICAEHVPENPQIIGDCPTYIPLNPSTPTATPTAAVPTGGVTGGVSTTPAGETPAVQTPYTTISYGTVSITVPVVHFTTEPGAPGATPAAPVGLVPGTAPPEVPAGSTTAGYATGVPATGAPYPIPSTMGTKTAPIATGTGAVRPSSPAEFTGAASPFKVVPVPALIGAALAFFAL